MPGREPIPEDETSGRPLEVCFFELVPDPPPGDTVVHRVDRTSSALATRTYNPSQILVALGLDSPQGPDETPAEWEAVVEAHYHTLERLVYSHALVPNALDHHTFLLTEPRDVEDEYVNTTPPRSLTKVDLARILEREQRLDPQDLLGKT